MLTVISTIIILGFIIFVHEFGHFIVAKRSGMRVDEFGLGFPPRIFGVKRGGTLYSVNWIPLGGFVKIRGENGEDAAEEDSFRAKSVPRRIAVILAGVTMNVVLALVLFSVGYTVGVPQAIESLPAGAIVSERSVKVGFVLAGSPAEKAGLRSGDSVEALGGVPVKDADGLRAAIKEGSGDIALRISRDRAQEDLRVTPEELVETGGRGIGVELIDVGMVRYPWYLAPVRGAETTIIALSNIAISFWQLLTGLFVGQVPAEVSGPVGIAAITGEVVRVGFRYVIEFTAILSLNLAVLNVIPFPALDGGRFLFLIIEALRGRAVSRKIEGIVHQAGFALLLILILAITYRDLVRYSGAIGGFFKRLF